jgi:hypothetical protein
VSTSIALSGRVSRAYLVHQSRTVLVGESLIELSGRVPWWNVDGDTMTTYDTREILFTNVPQEDSEGRSLG